MFDSDDDSMVVYIPCSDEDDDGEDGTVCLEQLTSATVREISRLVQYPQPLPWCMDIDEMDRDPDFVPDHEDDTDRDPDYVPDEDEEEEMPQDMEISEKPEDMEISEMAQDTEISEKQDMEISEKQQDMESPENDIEMPHGQHAFPQPSLPDPPHDQPSPPVDSDPPHSQSDPPVDSDPPLYNRQVKESDRTYDTSGTVNIYVKTYNRQYFTKGGKVKIHSRPNDLVHACKFCGKVFPNIQTHLFSAHKSEGEIM